MAATDLEDRNLFPKPRKKGLDVPGFNMQADRVVPHGRRAIMPGKSSRIRRKLAFNTDDDEEEGLDFTDKIAAFRSLFKPLKNTTSWSDNKKTLKSSDKAQSNHINDIESRCVSKVKVNENDESDRLKAVHSELGRQVDKELAKMSYINGQAHLHMMTLPSPRSGLNEGQGQKSDLDKYLTDNLKGRSSVSKILTEHVQSDSTDRKKGCANFSSGLENKQGQKSFLCEDKMISRSGQCVLLISDKLVHDNVNTKEMWDSFPQRNSSKSQSEDVHNDDYLAKFDRNLDIASRQNQRKLRNDEINLNKGKTDSSCSSDTLTDIDSLLNSAMKGGKKIQSNVPHYHPAWSCDNSESTSQRPNIKRMKQKSANGISVLNKPDFDIVSDNFEMSEFASSLVSETRHRRDLVDTPHKNDKYNKRNNRHHVKKRSEKDLPDSPERSSRTRQSKSNRNKTYRNESNSKHSKSIYEEIDIGLVSDSSKENIPEIDEVVVKVSSRSQFVEGSAGLSSQKNGEELLKDWLKDEDRIGREWFGGQDRLGDLQLVPEKDTTTVTQKTARKDAESNRKLDVSITESGRSSGSQSSVLNSAEFIKKLYKVDKKSREDLVLKARFFRRWQKTVQRNKRFRTEGRLTESNVSPIEYVDKQAATHAYVQNLDLDLIQRDAYESLLQVKSDNDTLVGHCDNSKQNSDSDNRTEELNYATRADEERSAVVTISDQPPLKNDDQRLDYKLQTSPDHSNSDDALPRRSGKSLYGSKEIWKRDSSEIVPGRSFKSMYSDQREYGGGEGRQVYMQQWQSKSHPREADGHHNHHKNLESIGNQKHRDHTDNKLGSIELDCLHSKELLLQRESVKCMPELGELKKGALDKNSQLGLNQQKHQTSESQKVFKMTQRVSCQTDPQIDNTNKVVRKVDHRDGTCQVEMYVKGRYQDQSSNTAVSSLNPHKDNSTMTTLPQVHRRKGDPPSSSLNHNLQVADIEQQLLDTANYGVCLQRSETFCRRRILANYFCKWRVTAVAMAKVRRADQLHQEHTLRKGLMALKWAINRSKIQEDILQNRMQIIVLRSKFVKWRDKAMKNRHERLYRSFSRWQTYTQESQRVRKLRELREGKILSRAMDQWKAVFYMRLKENRAVNHFSSTGRRPEELMQWHIVRRLLTILVIATPPERKNLLQEKIILWRIYTTRAKEKKQRNMVAVCFYNQHLQSKMFEDMISIYKKYTDAKTHQRKCLLHKVLMAWKYSAHVCKVERQRDMSIGKEHWRLVTIKSFFGQWHEQLLTQRARNSANKKLSRKTFMLWKTRWEENVQYREEEESRVRTEILHTSIQLWKANVDLLQKRRLAAVIYVQRVLVRHYIRQWCYYTHHRKELRIIQVRYTQTKNLSVQRKCFKMWRQKFEDKLDIQRAKQFWSNTCVRKAIVQWRKICHRRSLSRLLVATEPNRNLALQRVMFKRWLLAKSRVEEEKKSADEIRQLLQQSQLQIRFHNWWIATQRRLTVKPLVIRRERRFISDVFDSWKDLVRHKLQCRRSRDLLIKSQLRTRFTAWRRQYLIHQLEKEIYKKILQSMLQRCVSHWRQFIVRKQAAHNLHSKAVLKHTFYFWRDKAFGQLNHRKEEQEVQEYNTAVMKEHFGLWLSNVREQKAHQDGVVTSMLEQRNTTRIHKAFVSWRRLFRASIVARENQKLLCRRLQQRVIEEWQVTTQFTLREAVHNFALSLGLESPYHEEFNSQTTSTPRLTGADSLPDLMIGMNETLDLERSYPGSGFVSPYTSPSLGTPLKRLRSPCLSRISLDRLSTPEESRPSLAYSGFLDAKFAMEQAVKTDRLRTLVSVAIKRLRNWPVSVAFEQWRDHTVRQRELKQLSNQLVTFHHMAEMRLVLRVWRESYISSVKANEYRESVLKRKTFCILYQHKCEGKRKKLLAALAHNHISVNVFRKVFPYWYNKAQEKRHKERVLNLWTSVTQEEQQLLPLETDVRGRLHKKTLQKCFAVWSLKFQQIHKLKMAFNRIILQRYIDVWCEWASQRKDQRDKHVNFCHNRLTKQMFRTWCLRFRQKQEVERKHKEVWQHHLVEFVRSWHAWTVGAKQRSALSRCCRGKLEKNITAKAFLVWHQLTVKQQEVKAWYQRRLTVRVMYAWNQIAILQKKRKKQILEFQIRSYTKLVVRTYDTWYLRYMDKLRQHEEHEKVVHRKALQLGRKWRHKAQKTRGQHLHQIFLQRKVRSCFDKWHDGYQHILEQEDQLARYLVRQEWHIVGHYMDAWKTALLCRQAARVYSNKLTIAVFSEWRTYTRESKERREKYQLFRKASQQRILVCSFQYWVQITQVRMSVENHFNLKLQIRVLRAWCLYARQQRQLSRLSAVMTKRVHTRILKKTWYAMRGHYDYFHSLTDIADKVVHDKNRKCMQQMLTKWRERLNRVIAGQCYQHILTVRVVRTWRRFVYHKKQERRHEAEMWQQAIRHHNHKICKVVLEAWYDEIKIVHQIQRHKDRLETKYGKLWKLRVDIAYTAQLVATENRYKRFWKIWRLEFAQRKVANKIVLYNNRQLLAQVFVSWKAWYAKKRSKKQYSSIPVSRLSNSCETTPVASPRPSQIPTPYSGRTQQGAGNLSARFRERRLSRPS